MHKVRPTKKQKECVLFIQSYIKEHGYSPSYREIMVGCGYSSVATVALHINSLLKRGHLTKRDRSARSLEVVSTNLEESNGVIEVTEAQSKWLVDLINDKFIDLESGFESQTKLDHLYVLVGSLKILGFEDAARSFASRLFELQGRGE